MIKFYTQEGEDIMNEKDFLRTMIETIKYDTEYEKYRDKIPSILRYSIIDFHKTGDFGRKTNYLKEYIDLRVPIPLINEAKKYQKILNSVASQIYRETANYEYWGLKINPKPIGMDKDIVTEHDVTFSKIKEEIIQGIRTAKYTIWIAVAWFTDKDIFQELLLKKKQGINVRIITSDEQSNSYLMSNLEENFDLKKVPLKGEYLSNRIHDKFCVIDFEYVMHGSFNWSNNANKNDETLAIALDRDFAKKFADEFMRLYNEN